MCESGEPLEAQLELQTNSRHILPYMVQPLLFLRKFLLGDPNFDVKKIGTTPDDCTFKADCFKGHWGISFLFRLVNMGLRRDRPIYSTRMATSRCIPSYTMDSDRHSNNH